jgi:alpha-tubulin suppressor-like RCC1 family protein
MLLITCALSLGALWATGSSLHAQTGLPQRVLVWTRVAAPSSARFTAAVAAHAHSLALDDDGALWSAGSGAHGETGARPALGWQRVVVGEAVRFAAVASVLRHSVALDGDGALWAWGDNMWGQLGTGAQQAQHAPTRLRSFPQGVVLAAVSAGAAHTLAVDTVRPPFHTCINVLDSSLAQTGGVWGFGSNKSGQLALDGATLVLTPRALPLPPLVGDERVVGVHCGLEYSLLHTSRGRLFACGANAQGQLGAPPSPPSDSVISHRSR